MNSDIFDERPDHQAVSVLVHEFLHAMGLQGRPSREDFRTRTWPTAGSVSTVRCQRSTPPGSSRYTLLPTEIEPEDLSRHQPGAWEEEQLTSREGCRGSTSAFGTATASPWPWTTGIEPATALADNTRLAGTASWNGDLIGFTPTLDEVRGNAQVSVKLDTMNGRADFTELENEDNSMWGDGDLGYTITVGANYFRSTGGDAGTVNGQFYGANHESVGGSVERSDLSAAFAAVRR